jgi:hypothetical protein
MKTNINKTAILVLTSLVLLSNPACSTGRIIPAVATETPTPSNMPPTPSPSPTPDVAATRSAQATQAASQRESEIKAILSEYNIPTDTGHLLWDQEEPVSISLTGPEEQYKPLAQEIIASDFVIQTEVTWVTKSWPVCGIWFRSDDIYDAGAQYRFLFLRLSGLPAWDIEYFKYDRFVFNVTAQVKYSSDMDLASGATNKFLVMANDNEFTVYINGIRQGRYFDDSRKLSEGKFAVYASQDGNETTCTFDKTWIWSLK